MIRSAMLLVTALAMTACEQGDQFPQTTFRPVSEYGKLLNSVFYNTVVWTISILVIVVALILFAAVRFRERPGAPMPKQIHGHTGLEIGWTILPAIAVVFITVPTVAAIFDTQRRPPENALTIEVIGHQWWWEFRYPEYGITTANEAWMPTGRPISLKMKSVDVIHSFWIPKIGGKRDVNPLPRPREGNEEKHSNYLLWTVDQPGRYLGQCAEYCGEAHAIMRMTANAVEPAEFDAWVASMKATPAVAAAPVAGGDSAAQAAVPAPAPAPRIGQMPVPVGAGNRFVAPLADSILQAEGKRIFLGAPCITCHAIAGTTAQGGIGPNLTLVGRRPYIAAGALDNSTENLIRWIRNPQSVKPGAMMPGTTHPGGGMAPTRLSDQEVRAVAAYLTSLR
jgi:cytochrome c oxidase subunit II